MTTTENPWWEIWRLLDSMPVNVLDDSIHVDLALSMALEQTYDNPRSLAEMCAYHCTTPGALREDIEAALRHADWLATQTEHARRLVTDLPHPCREGGDDHAEPCTCPCRECGGEVGACACLPF